MPSVSSISVGANFAGNYAHKARHEMNASIMRLSSGNRTLMGGDAGGASVGNSLMAKVNLSTWPLEMQRMVFLHC